MKKILFVNDERQIGGVSIVLEDYLNNIDFKNNKVDLLVLHNNGDRFKNIPEEINIIYGDKYFDVVDLSFKQLIKSRKFIKAIKKAYISLMIKAGLIEKYIQNARKKLNILNYDIEIAFKDGFCTLFTAFGDSKKKVNWVHSDYATNSGSIDKYLNTFKKTISKFDTIVTLSSDIKNSFVNKLGNHENIEIINNFFDDKRITNMSQENTNVQLDSSKLNLICVGRLCYVKGFDRLLEALNRLKQDNLTSKLHIDIIGDGEIKEVLENKIAEYSLEDIITLLGKKDNPYSYMKQYDSVLLTSRTEAYCLVMVEALILKKPVLTTKVASSHEILCNEEYGIITENNLEGIYNLLKQVILNPDILKEKSHNLLQYDYSAKNASIIKQVEALLEV